jgi:hypothetical protein
VGKMVGGELATGIPTEHTHTSSFPSTAEHAFWFTRES